MIHAAYPPTCSPPLPRQVCSPHPALSGVSYKTVAMKAIIFGIVGLLLLVITLSIYLISQVW